MKEIPNLDELLNSFIDEELTLRNQTEVQRLVAHDEKIAQRLQQLQKYKMLLSSLPVAEAPPQILENVKASLARRTLLGEPPSAFDEKIGARHLLGRKVFAAAAMFGLVAVLAVVVYSIVAPAVLQKPIVAERRDLTPEINIPEPAPTLVVAAPFSGRLELQTKDLPAVLGFINRAIEENIPSDEWIASDQSDVREPHALICSIKNFNLLWAELDNIWNKLDSAALFIDTEVFGEQVVVGTVTAEQIVGIVNQDDPERRIEVAKNFAVLNNIAEHLPGREILTAIDDAALGLITPPKPVQTWNHKTIKKSAARTEAVRNIRLTITVTDSN
ncbi:MAG: hypothetical protein HQ580_01760 [Planctomycetes bacterium]|nr:hypothetical protein [Planctomycetota bacterium]